MNTEAKPLNPQFYNILNDANKESLVNAIQSAAETACEAHFAAEGRGANNKTFGYGFYEFIKFEFKKLSNSQPEVFSMVRRGGWIGLKVGPFELGFYRIGRSEKDDINKSFPANTLGAPNMVQLSLFEEEELDLTKANRFILGYMLNPDDGLCAVHIGVPQRSVRSNRVEDWAHSLLLWEIDRDTVFIPTDIGVSDDWPQVEYVEEVPLQKKRKGTEKLGFNGTI